MHSQVLTAPSDRVWEAAIAAAAELGYTVSSANQTRRVIVASRDYPEAAFREYVADAIGRLERRWWRLEVTLILSVTDVSPQHTRVAIEGRLMGRASPALPGVQRSGLTIVPLESNGRLEQQFLERIATDVRRRNAAHGLMRPPGGDAIARRSSHILPDAGHRTLPAVKA
ncbi:MAG: hypothetical protein HY352_04915 [Candidatus Omnitrophica bacterium]|nr:hypothetical protein [Candidatus Omnitrophota bacterium]